MTSNRASLDIKNALNKLDTQDFQNITPTQIQEAVNKAAIRFVRQRLPMKEVDKMRVDDLQVLLVPSVRLSGSNKDIFFLSRRISEDYLSHSRVTAICSKGPCSSVRIKSQLVEDANVDDMLSSWDQQPSFKFEQCFHILSSNRIKVYHNKDFTVSEIELSYYRKPVFIQFEGAVLPDRSRGRRS